ncbi:MAG: GTP cyclohydrolase FolE2 [Casimicrobiaceae bacterium]|nr:GTP cyclohydrolase FolE2 [Casimicrobiaceae bacterium]MCX8099552.1 GTP cyclohydrolase FolE2 [Casimicrobiaceae bacterium]
MNAIEPLDPTSATLLEDVQGRPDTRCIAIDRVGIRGLCHPVRVRARSGQVQATVARWSLSVGLSATVKGAHMSRFAELVNAIDEPLDTAAFRRLEAEMRRRLEAPTGRIEMRFPWFHEKRAPVSRAKSLLDIDAAWIAETGADGVSRLELEVVVPVTSLCPSSKAIADYGAHNQRTHVTIRAEAGPQLCLEDLVDIAEAQASAELYAVLKRADEKYVTERAYDHPKFVEDLVRDLALALTSHPQVEAFFVACENFESIHNHSAYAELRGRGGRAEAAA